MAKTEGTQSIPAALLDAYRSTLGEQRPNTVIEKRYPYRVRHMQDTGADVSPAQRIQRDRFKTVQAQFRTLSAAERARWYAAMPPWSSLLWYYNFFILSGLMDVLGADARGASVIKLIQNRTLSVPTAGTTITHATVIDSAKAVVMIWGAGYDFSESVADNTPYAWAWPVYPIWGTLTNTNLSLTWSMTPQAAAKIAVQVIEYL